MIQRLTQHARSAIIIYNEDKASTALDQSHFSVLFYEVLYLELVLKHLGGEEDLLAAHSLAVVDILGAHTHNGRHIILDYYFEFVVCAHKDSSVYTRDRYSCSCCCSIMVIIIIIIIIIWLVDAHPNIELLRLSEVILHEGLSPVIAPHETPLPVRPFPLLLLLLLLLSYLFLQHFYLFHSVLEAEQLPNETQIGVYLGSLGSDEVQCCFLVYALLPHIVTSHHCH